VQSVNGPSVTIIQGNPAVGSNAVRCVYLTNNASLIGFTLTNGATLNAGDVIKEQSGGGAWCETTNCLLLNCVAVTNAAAQYGGGSYGGNASNCGYFFNFATAGGGAAGGILSSCTLATNSAAPNRIGNGGGSCSNTLNNCVVLANKAGAYGAGAYGSMLNGCAIGMNSNSLVDLNDTGGAGLYGCQASACVLSNNFSDGRGGGASNSSLTNCLVLNNTAGGGGGVYGSTLTNCTLSDNVASGGSGGGGAYLATLYNCIVSGNQAPAGSGGGGNRGTFNNCLICSNAAPTGSAAYSAALNNCTILGHTNGSAAYSCALNNSILYYNSTNYSGGSLAFCCTTPMPAGPGNFTNEPAFVDLNGGNFRLQTNSPCINSGNNLYVAYGTDLDGRPRIVAGTVDMGAYEFQGSGMGEFIAWLLQNGMPTDGSADFNDADGDGVNNWQEWVAGTNPTNSLSLLTMLTPTKGASGLNLSWVSVGDRSYFLQRSTNLLAHPPFLTLASDIPGQVGTTTYSDTTAVGPGPFLYRVGIQGAPTFPPPPFSIISFAWLQEYGLPTDGSADFLDADGDGMNNWQEWIAGTNPTNSASVLTMLATSTAAPGVRVTWQSVSGRTYFLQRSTNLSGQSPFSAIRSNLAGQAGSTSYSDATATNGGPFFYRVGVQ
jgi:hypothetical protein